MEKLKGIGELLQMTMEAQRLVPISDELGRLKTLLADMRRIAKQNYEQERGKRIRSCIGDPTRFELCMIGIREELNFGRGGLGNIPALKARLWRIREDIERTQKELTSNRQLQ